MTIIYYLAQAVLKAFSIVLLWTIIDMALKIMHVMIISALKKEHKIFNEGLYCVINIALLVVSVMLVNQVSDLTSQRKVILFAVITIILAIMAKLDNKYESEMDKCFKYRYSRKEVDEIISSSQKTQPYERIS